MASSSAYKQWDALPEQTRHLLSQLVMDKMPGIMRSAQDKGWPAHEAIDLHVYFDQAIRDISGLGCVWLEGGYLLLYSEASSWWVKGKVLMEELLLAVTTEHDFGKAISSIESLAKDLGCSAVCIGTAASPSNEVYARLLKRYGFKPLAYQLLKEV